MGVYKTSTGVKKENALDGLYHFISHYYLTFLYMEKATSIEEARKHFEDQSGVKILCVNSVGEEKECGNVSEAEEFYKQK